MTTSWTIAIDWDRNGNYTDAYDDVTSRVITAKWFLGMEQPYRDAVDNSTLELVLDNSDKRYSPENNDSPLSGKLVPFRPVRIQSDDGSGQGQPRTHWVGWVESILPDVNKNGKRLVHLVATGPLQFFKAAETKLKLQTNKRSDEIIAELIKEVVIPPALTDAWILGRVGFSELGNTTKLANITAYSNLYDPSSNPNGEKGLKTLAMAADNWVRQGGLSDVEQDSFDVYHAISDITAAERGKFLFDREGKVLFWNRHHLLDDRRPAALTLDDGMTDMAYTYAGIDRCKNEVIAVCHPRTIGATTNDILWQLGDAIIRVEPGKTRDVYVKYEDDSKNRIGAQEVTVTDLEFESGTASVTVEENANGANLKFTNAGTVAAIIKKCIVRGRKITDSGQMEARATDDASIIDYGRRSLRINLPSIDDLEDAQDIADFERTRRGKPRGMVSTVTVLSHAKLGGGQHAHQLARTIGDLVTIKETQSGHQSEYYIIGEAHELMNGGEVLKTIWYLERQHTYAAPKVQDIQPADLLAYWKLADESGTTMLDSSGNGRNGTASGVTWGDPGIGDGVKAAKFDGVNDYCNPYSSGFNNVWNGQEFTISGWFKVASASVWTDGQTRTIFSFRNQDSPVDSIVLRKDSANNQLTCEYSANGVTKSVTVTSYSPTGWVHFAVTVSYSTGTGEMKFFLDGVQQGTTQTGLGQWNNAQGLQTDICIGAATPSTNFWSGDLAHVAVWDKALLVTEVINLSKAVTPIYPWKLGVNGRSNLGASTLLTY